MTAMDGNAFKDQTDRNRSIIISFTKPAILSTMVCTHYCVFIQLSNMQPEVTVTPGITDSSQEQYVHRGDGSYRRLCVIICFQVQAYVCVVCVGEYVGLLSHLLTAVSLAVLTHLTFFFLVKMFARGWRSCTKWTKHISVCLF